MVQKRLALGGPMEAHLEAHLHSTPTLCDIVKFSVAGHTPGVVYLVTEPGENCVKPVTCNRAVQISVANRLIVADPCTKM